MPASKTSAPLGAVYLIADTVGGWPGGGTFAYISPSSWRKSGGLGAVPTLVSVSRLTPAGSRLAYWAWVGIVSHSQPT